MAMHVSNIAEESPLASSAEGARLPVLGLHRRKENSDLKHFRGSLATRDTKAHATNLLR